MEIQTRKEKVAVVVSVKGRMDAVTAPEFEKNVIDLISKGEKTFLVNFAELDYISSAGLRSILALAKKLKEKGGKILFAGLRGPWRRFSKYRVSPPFSKYSTPKRVLSERSSPMRILLNIKLPAKLENLGRWMEAVSECAREQGFDQKKIGKIELALKKRW